ALEEETLGQPEPAECLAHAQTVVEPACVEQPPQGRTEIGVFKPESHGVAGVADAQPRRRTDLGEREEVRRVAIPSGSDFAPGIEAFRGVLAHCLEEAVPAISAGVLYPDHRLLDESLE